MGGQVIGRLTKSRLNLRQIEQMIVFAAQHPPQSGLSDSGDDGAIAILPIQTHNPLGQRKVVRGQVAGNDGEALEQLAAIVAVACPRKSS